MVRFCGEIILPRTPPELLAAASSSGGRPDCWAALTCSAPKSAFAEVSDPETATPNQPSTGERKASPAPAAATKWPIVAACPGQVHDVGEGQHARSPSGWRSAVRRRSRRHSRTASPARTPRTACRERFRRRARGCRRWRPGAATRMLPPTGLPSGSMTFRKGQSMTPGSPWRRQSLTGGICAIGEDHDDEGVRGVGAQHLGPRVVLRPGPRCVRRSGRRRAPVRRRACGTGGSADQRGRAASAAPMSASCGET